MKEELQKEQEQLEEQKRIEEENETKRLKNSKDLTQEQIRNNRKYIFFRRKESISNF